MYPIKYHRATSTSDAVAVLSNEEDAVILAGGQTLLATMKQHLAAPGCLVDIRGIEGMSEISADGTLLTVGAAATHAEVAGNAEVKRLCPALAELADGIGDPAVRNMGTIGGSIANNDPAADYPAALLALAATIVTNVREIPSDDFFTSLFATSLDEGEIVTAVKIAAPSRAAYAKFAQPASLFALVGAFVADGAGGVRAAITGSGEDGVFRHGGMEAALESNWSIESVDRVDVSADGLMSDIHGDAAYRANLIKVMTRRAVAAAP